MNTQQSNAAFFILLRVEDKIYWKWGAMYSQKLNSSHDKTEMYGEDYWNIIPLR